MDKVRERGAPLPGNDKENWGNRHTGIWRKNKWKKRKRGEKKTEEVEIEELTEEEHGDGKLTSNKASEWGKLGGNWNNRNEEKREEKDEEENWRIGKEIPGLEMEEKRKEVWKVATREKEGNVKEYWGNHHNGAIGIWRGKRRVRKKLKNKKGRKKREKRVEIQEKEEPDKHKPS